MKQTQLLGVPSVNKTDLQALTLVGPHGTSLELDPLRLDNRLFILSKAANIASKKNLNLVFKTLLQNKILKQ